MALRLGIGPGIIPPQARPAPTTAPVNTVAPSITGILTSGQTLTANPGTWTGLPGPNYAYQWKRNGTNISGATGATRVANDTDVAAGASAVTVEVTATNDIGSTPAASAGVTIAATLALSGTPGSATVGVPFSFTPTRVGGHLSYSFALTGTLPAGLSFSTSTGAITGTPLSSGTASGLNITVTDGNGLTASLGVFALVVSSAAPSLVGVFGQLSRSQSGSGYPVSGTSIASGANANHFQISGGYIFPSATGVAAGLNAGPYTFTLDNSETVQFSTVANAYSCRTQAEYEAVAALSVASMKGKTILLRGGESFQHKIKESGGPFYRSDYGPGGVIVRSDDASDPAILTGGQVEVTAKALTIRNVIFEEAYTTKIYLAGTVTHPVSDFTLDGCDLKFPARDLHYDYDAEGENDWVNQDAIRTNGEAYNSNITITNNTIRYSKRGVVLYNMGTITVTGNDIGPVWSIGIQITYPPVGFGANNPSYIRDNKIWGFASLSSDSGNPHQDSILFSGRNTQETDWTVTVERNECWKGDARGDCGPIAFRDTDRGGIFPGKYFIATVIGNVLVDCAFEGICIECAKDCTVLGNTVTGRNTGAPHNRIPISVGGPGLGDIANTTGLHEVRYNIAEAYDIGGATTYHSDNVTLGLAGVTNSYASVFDGPTWVPNTLAQLRQFYDMKAAGPADLSPPFGAGAYSSGVVTFATTVPGSNGANIVSPTSRVPVNTVAPAVTGSAAVGNTLTCSTGTWLNSPISYAYQWERSDNGSTGWADLSGATASTYAVQSGDNTKYLRCGVIATNGAGVSTEAFSSATSQVGGGVPAISVAPAVTGTAQVGQTLTASNGTWTNSPTGYTYQWERSDNGTTGWADVSGATASTYVPVSGDIGKYLRAGVIASNGAGAGTEAFSGATAAVIDTSGPTAFPQVRFSSATRLLRASAGALAASDSNVGGVGFRFRKSSPPASATRLFGGYLDANQARFEVIINTNGTPLVWLYDSSASRIKRIDPTYIECCDGNWHTVLASWNAADTNLTTGRSMYIDDVDLTNTGEQWEPGAPDLNATDPRYSFGAGQTTPAYLGQFDLEFFWAGFGSRPALASQPDRDKFLATAIGLDGSGPTGSQPEIFFVGPATDWNSGSGINRGNGSKFFKDGTNVADVGTPGTWP